MKRRARPTRIIV